MEHKQIIQTVRLLYNLRDSKFPILSVYLGEKGKKSPAVQVLLSQFHSLIYKNLSEEEEDKFNSDIKRIENYLKDFLDTRGKRSVVFFTAGKNLFKALDFEFYLSPFCTISGSPYLTPVIKSLGIHERYLVLLVDRKRARMFTVHLGEIEEKMELLGEVVPQKVKAGDDAWDQQNKILRHIEDHLHRHLKLIAQKVGEFVKDKGINFIIIGGHKELFPKIKKHLSKTLKDLILGEFVTELNIPLNEIFLQSKKIAEDINKRKVQ